ncbi:hypothetical protein PC116_g826 [Phytophthora cactorum]|nr:hypothetical protein PC114_g4937 [Phytophthora cactorum]KAG3038246.1 hypothetical protein PC119_g2976 [Phytophthora cactorum]KAG4251510.1 hypothetical protein PC116_g826 [Phytophthora cactorum]
MLHPVTERVRRSREPVFLLEDGIDEDVERQTEETDGPPSPKRARTDEDRLLVEAVLAYAARIDGVLDTPSTYDEAVSSSGAAGWQHAMKEELLSHS